MWDGQMPQGNWMEGSNARPPGWKVRENAPLLPGKNAEHITGIEYIY